MKASPYPCKNWSDFVGLNTSPQSSEHEEREKEPDTRFDYDLDYEYWSGREQEVQNNLNRKRARPDFEEIEQKVMALMLKACNLIRTSFSHKLHDVSQVTSICKLYAIIHNNLQHCDVYSMVEDFELKVQMIERFGWNAKR